MISEIFKAFLFIFIAEMGDKTQILAMTFATKYSIKEVLGGVFIGSLLNHGIAIILGALLSNVIPINSIQIVAGVLFIGFGFWSLKIDDDELEEDSKNNYGPIVTVAIAFFIGELGDKTQLTAMTLATDSLYPILTLMGTVLGMVVTSSFGIFVGSRVGEKIPEFFIKVSSSLVFTFFGSLKIIKNVPYSYLNTFNIILFLLLIITPLAYLINKNFIIWKSGKITALKEAAATLYNYTHKINEVLEEICLSENECGMCKGKGCLIGYTKHALKHACEKEEYILSDEWNKLPNKEDKDFDLDKVIYALSLTLLSLEEYNHDSEKNYVINRTKNALEKLIFGEELPSVKNIESYINLVKKNDKEIADKILKAIKEIKIQEN